MMTIPSSLLIQDRVQVEARVLLALLLRGRGRPSTLAKVLGLVGDKNHPTLEGLAEVRKALRDLNRKSLVRWDGAAWVPTL